MLLGCGETKEIGQDGYIRGFIGGVATDEPRAAIVGRDVLGRGGSAADSATAMFFTLAVTKPSVASLGAVGGCVHFDSLTRTFSAFDFMPRQASAGGRIQIAPPGAVRGMAALQARHGAMSWGELVGPAEALARFGHAVSRSLARDIAASADEVARDPGLRAIFVRPDGRIATEGDQVRQLELAASLAQIRQRGAGALYAGPLAQAYVAGVAAIGGVLTADDLRSFTPREVAPILRPAGDHLMAFLPTATSNGPQQARLWRILGEERALDRADRDARLHVVAEAAVLAHGDFARFARQPGADIDLFDDAAVARLDQRFAGFDSGRARPVAELLDGVAPIPSEVSGASLVAVDRIGRAVACGFTLFRNFGPGRLLPGIGAPPALAPPAGVISGAVSPVVVGNKNTGNFFLALGGVGAGSASTLMTIAARTLRGGESVNEAVGAPRFSRGGGPTTVFVEKDVGQEARAALAARGYTVEESPPIALVNAAYCERGLPRDEDTCDIRTDWRGHGLASTAR